MVRKHVRELLFSSLILASFCLYQPSVLMADELTGEGVYQTDLSLSEEQSLESVSTVLENQISLSSAYLEALETYAQTSGDDRSQKSAEAILQEESDQLVQQNVYQAQEEDRAVLVTVEQGVISDEEVQDELTSYAAQLITGIRQQFGRLPVEVTEQSKWLAQEIAKQNVASQWGWEQTRAYQHNQQVLVDVSAQLPNYQKAAVTENLETFHLETSLTNLAYLKEMIYLSVLDFLFNKREWQHAMSIAGLKDKSETEKVYFGLSFHTVNQASAWHFISYEDSDFKSQSSNFTVEQTNSLWQGQQVSLESLSSNSLSPISQGNIRENTSNIVLKTPKQLPKTADSPSRTLSILGLVVTVFSLSKFLGKREQ